MRIVKTELFLFPQCLPTAFVQSFGDPAQPLTPVLMLLGVGQGHPGTAARSHGAKTLDLVIPDSWEIHFG